MQEQIGVQGALAYEVWDAQTVRLGPDGWPVIGRVLARGRGPNLVVDSGLTLIRDRMQDGTTATAPSRFALGTGNTPAAAGDTGLVTEVWIAALTRAQPGPVGTAIYQYFLASTVANGHTLREAALRNALDIQLARYVLPTPIVKTTAVAVTFTWHIIFGV